MKRRNKMNKNDFIKAVQAKATIEIPQKDLVEVFKATEEVVREAVLTGEEVTIPGVCKVKVKEVPERTGTVMMGANKGEKWVKPAHKEACVKILSSLKKIFE